MSETTPRTPDEPDKPVVVMKFGGSSVADLSCLSTVADKVVARTEHARVVVVVSAMGKTTNSLIAEARQLCDPPPARELDMLLTTGERQSMSLLAIAIAARGRSVISLTGSQCGIITDHRHGRARIMEVRPFRVLDELEDGRVVIVGGFQGVSYRRDVTTIGRGGTDSTAVALAAALGADCEIYSDVDGVYSADPRVVDDARRLDQIGYDEMQALSRAGARVLHSQAVQLARERGIAIYARRTDGTGKETVVRHNPEGNAGVHAVTADPEILELEVLLDGEDHATIDPRVLAQLGDLGLFYLNVTSAGLRGVLSRSRRADADEIVAAVKTLAKALDPAHRVLVRKGRALVSCVGTGLEERGDTYAEMTRALAESDIPIHSAYSDANTISVAVPAPRAACAVRALHAALIAR